MTVPLNVLCFWICTFKREDKNALLLLLPYVPQKEKHNQHHGGFGSIDAIIALSTMLCESENPLLELVIQGKTFNGLLDIGEREWPEKWLLQEATVGLIGLGGKNPFSSMAQQL